jgi:hypothetical protein
MYETVSYSVVSYREFHAPCKVLHERRRAPSLVSPLCRVRVPSGPFAPLGEAGGKAFLSLSGPVIIINVNVGHFQLWSPMFSAACSVIITQNMSAGPGHHDAKPCGTLHLRRQC